MATLANAASVEWMVLAVDGLLMGNASIEILSENNFLKMEEERKRKSLRGNLCDKFLLLLLLFLFERFSLFQG